MINVGWGEQRPESREGSGTPAFKDWTTAQETAETVGKEWVARAVGPALEKDRCQQEGSPVLKAAGSSGGVGTHELLACSPEKVRASWQR